MATPNDGCSIATLAKAAGLKAEEYLDWLTVTNPDYEIQLFNGSTKMAKNLAGDDVLLAPCNNLFYVPNTIYAAYCFDPAMRGTTFQWSRNLDGLNRLGFNVVTFYNSSLSGYSEHEARLFFLNQISTLSSSKKLHGLYIVSHGSNVGFAVLKALILHGGLAETLII